MIKVQSPTLTVLDPLSTRLAEVEALLTARVDASHSPLEAALASLIAAGGKRIRPKLALLSGSLFGAKPAPLLYAAAAVEMLHTASLVHDDLVDGAGLRRGLETLNAHWSSAASVLVGDYAFTQAAQLVLTTRCLPAIDLFTDSMRRMVEGELTQLARPHGLASREQYLDWIRAKTAVLFELAAGVPALLAETEAEAVASARAFGEALGMAFQIVDDVLDFTGEAASLGKPVGQDLRQGVLTLPALIHLEAHPDDPGLQAIIERQPLAAADLEWLVAGIRTGGAIAASKDVARHFVRHALEALDRLPDRPERLSLAHLAESLITRNK